MWLLESSNLLVNDSRITSTQWCSPGAHAAMTPTFPLLISLIYQPWGYPVSFMEASVSGPHFLSPLQVFWSTWMALMYTHLVTYSLVLSPHCFQWGLLLPFQLPKTTRLLSSGAVPLRLKILNSNIPLSLQFPIFIALLFHLCALVNMIGTFSNVALLT